MAKVKRTPGPAAGPLRAALANIDNAVGKVGWFETAHYPDGMPVAYVASVHEYGYPAGNIPPRLGMRATIEEKRPELARVAAGASKQVLAGKMTAWQAMELLGLAAAGMVRKRIAGPIFPPLKVDTVKRRLAGKKQGRVVSVSAAKPLVDTGELLGSVTNVVDVK